MGKSRRAPILAVLAAATAACSRAPDRNPGFCGDGFVNVGEVCDDGNAVQTDACTTRCAPPTCGDGIVQAPEECDDGNQSDADACLGTCVAARCGDGFVQAGVEQCDPAGPGGLGACRADCTFHVCGDGVLGDAEGCDDGNTADGDGCSATCAIEAGWCCIDRNHCVREGTSPPGDPCRVCAPATSKTAWSASGPVACDDGLFCNGADTCSGGTCAVHTGDPCGAVDICHEATKTCTAPPPPPPQCTTGADCDDGIVCTRDQCLSGVCSNTKIPGCIEP
jgi:cysteine-rich repeat protein